MFRPLVTIAALLASASRSACAPAVFLTGRPVVDIVYDPMITAPTSDTIWNAGETREVQWNPSDAPAAAENVTGTILLGYLNNGSEHLNLAQPLASGFRIMSGAVNVTVPTVEERKDYIVVLFGDSGNASPLFTILNGTSTSSTSL